MKKTLMGSLVLLAAAWMLQSCESSPEALNLDAAKQRVSAAAEKVAKFKLKVVND